MMKMLKKIIAKIINNKSEGGQDLIAPHFLNLSKMKKKHIRPVTIEKTTNFLNILRGKSFNTSEMNNLAKEHNVRSGIQVFAERLGLATKFGTKYTFKDMDFEPFHARKIATMSNEYNAQLTQAKIERKAKEESESTQQLISFQENQKIISMQLEIQIKEENIAELEADLKEANNRLIILQRTIKEMESKINSYDSVVEELNQTKQLLLVHLTKK